jgi:hypothetical protein
VVLAGCATRLSCMVLGALASVVSLDYLPGDVIEGRPDAGVPFSGGGDSLVCDEVGAGAAGCVVFGGGDEELAGGVEGVGVPAAGEHALAENQVDVLTLADSEAQPDIHL